MEPPKRRSLPFQSFDLSLHRSRQHRGGCISAKPSELVFEVLFGLRGNIPDPLLRLKISDEVPGDGHR